MFAVGLNKNTLLVQSKQHEEGNVQVDTMWLVEQKDFKPKQYRVVTLNSEASAMLLAGLYNIVHGVNVRPLLIKRKG
jgi:hypothetical protein